MTLFDVESLTKLGILVDFWTCLRDAVTTYAKVIKCMDMERRATETGEFAGWVHVGIMETFSLSDRVVQFSISNFQFSFFDFLIEHLSFGRRFRFLEICFHFSLRKRYFHIIRAQFRLNYQFLENWNNAIFFIPHPLTFFCS